MSELLPINNAFAAGKYESIRRKSKPDQQDKASRVNNDASNKESVHISESSLNLQKIWDKIKVLPEVRIEKVEEIKKEIRNNNYPIENHLYKAMEKMIKGYIIDVEE
ncbi:MAG: hypothetical protein GF401_04090 [Chitinivibrionales bacterium]|nr:hypothetical protein [Chitinivibrionales bacterium]